MKAAIAEFHPQSPALKKVVARCVGFVVPDPPAPDGFIPLTSMTESSRHYAGTAEGFFAALPDYFRSAMAASGTAGDYTKEMEYIAGVVRNCAAIKPARDAALGICDGGVLPVPGQNPRRLLLAVGGSVRAWSEGHMGVGIVFDKLGGDPAYDSHAVNLGASAALLRNAYGIMSATLTLDPNR